MNSSAFCRKDLNGFSLVEFSSGFELTLSLANDKLCVLSASGETVELVASELLTALCESAVKMSGRLTISLVPSSITLTSGGGMSVTTCTAGSASRALLVLFRVAGCSSAGFCCSGRGSSVNVGVGVEVGDDVVGVLVVVSVFGAEVVELECSAVVESI